MGDTATLFEVNRRKICVFFKRLRCKFGIILVILSHNLRR